jgi:hypothetical protein
MNVPAMVTPARAALVLVVIGAGIVTFLGLAVTKSLPLTVSGLAVLGLSLLVLGLVAAAGAVRAGREGLGAKAVAAALFGGLCVLGASGSLSLAIIMGMLAAST